MVKSKRSEWLEWLAAQEPEEVVAEEPSLAIRPVAKPKRQASVIRGIRPYAPYQAGCRGLARLRRPVPSIAVLGVPGRLMMRSAPPFRSPPSPWYCMRSSIVSQTYRIIYLWRRQLDLELQLTKAGNKHTTFSRSVYNLRRSKVTVNFSRNRSEEPKFRVCDPAIVCIVFLFAFLAGRRLPTHLQQGGWASMV